VGQLGIARIEPATLEHALHPRSDPFEHDADFVIRRDGSGWKSSVTSPGAEDAV
jgi:hypothetical protein